MISPLKVLPVIDFLHHQMPRSHGNPHGFYVPLGLDTLMSGPGVTITTDKTTYKVGEVPTYRISGGTPFGHVAWTSFKNGQPTGEFQADYPGDDLDGSGTLTIRAGGPWRTEDVGEWQKQVLIVPADYAGDYSTLQTGQVFFTVAPPGGQTTTSKSAVGKSSVSGILEQKLDLPFVGQVPILLVGGAALVGIFLLTGSGSRGRR